MQEETLLKDMGIPKITWDLRTFPMNQLEARLTLSQRKLLKEYIESRGIRLLATLKESNTNIPKYEDEKVRYEEVLFFKIKVKSHKKNKEIFKIFSRIIPYAQVIVFECNKSYKIVLSELVKTHDSMLKQSDNPIYETKDSIHITDMIQYIHFDNIDKTNLYHMYKDIKSQLVKCELEILHKSTLNNKNEAFIKEIEEIDKQINQLTRAVKNEKQLNLRIPKQIQLTELKKKRKLKLEGE